MPSCDLYKRSIKGGTGTTFGPGRGRQAKPRFQHLSDLTVSAYLSGDRMPRTTLYKEKQAPAWGFSRTGMNEGRSGSAGSLSAAAGGQRVSPQGYET